MNTKIKNTVIFVMEERESFRDRIREVYRRLNKGFKIVFFNRQDSIFELMDLRPDYIVTDFDNKKYLHLDGKNIHNLRRNVRSRSAA